MLGPWPSPPEPSIPTTPPTPAPLDWFLYTLAILKKIQYKKKGVRPTAPNNQLPPRSLSLIPSRFILPGYSSLLSPLGKGERLTLYPSWALKRMVSRFFLEKYKHKEHHHTTDLALKLAKASGLCRPL